MSTTPTAIVLSSVALASRILGSRSLGIAMEHISAWICQAASMPAADHWPIWRSMGAAMGDRLGNHRLIDHADVRDPLASLALTGEV